MGTLAETTSPRPSMDGSHGMAATLPHFPWLQSDLGKALACAPGVIATLVTGILMGLPASGAVATGAAVTVGFGAFKKVRGSALAAMTLVGIGVCISTFVGTLAGCTTATMILAVLVWGFATGLFPVLESDAGWVAQQWTIMLMVAGAYPGFLEQATQRTLLVMAGAALQILCVAGSRLLAGLRLRPIRLEEVREAAAAAMTVLRREVTSLSPATLRASWLAVILSVAVAAWRCLGLPNGYWMAMTVLLLVRPDLRGTSALAAERIAGTLVGAAVATLLTRVVPVANSPAGLAVLIGCFSLLSLVLRQGNRIGSRAFDYVGSYAVFAACLTAYVVLLLDYAGLEVGRVATNRVLLTVAGGALALLLHVPFAGSRGEPKPGVGCWGEDAAARRDGDDSPVQAATMPAENVKS